MEIDTAGVVSGDPHYLAPAAAFVCVCVCVQGFNTGNYARHPVCSSLLFQSTLKVRPYIFMYKCFKRDGRLHCFQPKHLLDILRWLLYAALRLAIPVGFYRKTLHLYCFIKKISQACNACFHSCCRAKCL